MLGFTPLATEALAAFVELAEPVVVVVEQPAERGRGKKKKTYPFLRVERPLTPVEVTICLREKGKDGFWARATVHNEPLDPVLDPTLPQRRPFAPDTPWVLKPLPLTGNICLREAESDGFSAECCVSLVGEMRLREVGEDMMIAHGGLSWDTEDEKLIAGFLSALNKRAA